MPPQKKPPAPPRAAAKGDADLDLINSLAGILNATGLTEIELDRKGTRVRVSRQTTAVASVAMPQSLGLGHHVEAPHPAPVVAAAPAKPADHPGTVKSPMVGTVYRSSTPGSPSFVEIGAEVKEGQTLLIIEAMKTMNQIPSPRSGRVTHVFVENAQPVEYGEPLVVIE